ncbi:MAG: rod shape-determining protein MreD [Alphaproteobacteria bacterium]|jgi:rod shape-determining protein MreD|nr:rod shape-determining protein MreD [Alphaproteobacteria bacterium]
MGYRAEHLLSLLKTVAPLLLGLLGVIILALPIRLFEGAAPTPIIPLVVVFFWSIYAPAYMPSVSVFLIGILQDLLTGGPLGLWAAVYLVTQFVVMSQRSYFLGREQKVVWLGFALAAASASLMLWLVMSLMSGGLLPVGALLAQMTTTVLIYPLFGVAFGEFHRRILVEA